ncbi:D-alanyl-D-alanine carboxypeptidase/D-alanyl-D-alanine-endopeptidase [Knoellia sp. LjRoot47]|uniref:D-alanyl-D-alanine carboxypeptidase/D-alanyl-D-alanine-endopeptidase n=1 Tax=Knoellia sp. LjRoot47 TaxID=3342330 RepID=UPI003ECE1A83
MAGVTLLLVGGVGYAAADVADLAPGILTYDGAPVDPPTPTGSPSASPVWAALPSAAPATATPSPTATAAGAVPTTAGLTKALAALAKDPWLGPSVGISVRDGVTGTELYAVSPSVARAPASTLKLLAAVAITEHLDPDARMTTKVVGGKGPAEIVLVAGGDTRLGEGASDPASVEGRAGLATLADEVAESLRDRRLTAVTLSVDASYAAGPRYPAKWKAIDVRDGFTQGVAMLGRATERPRIGRPSVAVAEVSVAGRLAALLTQRGIATTLAPFSGHGTRAPDAAQELGSVESATYREIVDLALGDSDDALTENLVRQAMAAAGVSAASPAAPPAFVRESLVAAGVDVTGYAALDTSGLAYGQLVSTTTLSEVLTLATTDRNPWLREVVANLPVAGLDGTLSKRFQSRETKAVAGIPRAKTGTLTGISSLAGTTVTADGRLVTFTILADRVPASSGTLGARAALDRFVTALTLCGCH